MNYVIAIITAVFVSLSAYGLHNLDVDHINHSHEVALAKQSAVLTQSCQQAQAATEKVSHDYQDKIASLSSRVDALKRMHQLDRCITVTPTGSASGHDAPYSPHVPPGSGNGSGQISYGKYIDLLAEGEKYRLQLQECQAFVTAEKEAEKPHK